jgi:hypothetical protein
MSKRRERLADLVAAADCVLSCASSAGIEAARAGRPVIQLLPAGSGNILPAEWYGLRGSARSLEELRQLLSETGVRTKKEIRHRMNEEPVHA